MYILLLGIFCLLISFYPYFVWEAPISPTGIACLILSILYIIHIKNDKKTFVFNIIISSIYIVICLRGGYSFFGVISLLMICSLFFSNKIFICNLFLQFCKLYAILMGISFLMYVMVVLLEIPLSGEVINPLHEGKIGITYYKYPFLVVADSFDFLRYRFEGIFDEPGVVGTISGVCLFTNRFNLSKWYNIIILIVGIFSMSLYFYLLSIIFVIFKLPMKYKLFASLLIVILVFIFFNNEIVYELLLRRFDFSDSSMSWNNRDHMSNQWYESFQNSTKYLYGYGVGASNIYNYGGSSYKNIIIDHGIILFCSYVFAFLLYGIICIRKFQLSLLYAIIFLSIIFQRPYIDNVGYVFLMFAPIHVLSNINIYEKKTNCNFDGHL